MIENKNARFRRLAKLRGERALEDLRLIGNLSNRNNYEYNEAEIKTIFNTIEEELRFNKSKFYNKKRGIKL